MSKENVKKFIQEIAKNEAIQEQVVLLAQKVNIIFTRKELIEALAKAEIVQLKDEELVKVSGGAIPTAVNSQITDSVT